MNKPTLCKVFQILKYVKTDKTISDRWYSNLPVMEVILYDVFDTEDEAIAEIQKIDDSYTLYSIVPSYVLKHI